jgi:hypothetical protein
MYIFPIHATNLPSSADHFHVVVSPMQVVLINLIKINKITYLKYKHTYN